MEIVLIVLVVLLLTGYLPIKIVEIPLFNLNGRVIDLWDVIVFFIIIYLIDALPRPFREIVVIFLVLWLLSVLGIISIAGFSNILVLALIVGLVLYLLGGRRK